MGRGLSYGIAEPAGEAGTIPAREAAWHTDENHGGYGALSDRAVAERAGLGWIGKNTSLLTPEFGSWVYLGEMLTDAPFPPDQPVEEECGDCTLCIDSCPTGAIIQGGQLNAQRCVAFLTQRKDDIPEEFRSVIGNRLYGCDTCQQVCQKTGK